MGSELRMAGEVFLFVAKERGEGQAELVYPIGLGYYPAKAVRFEVGHDGITAITA